MSPVRYPRKIRFYANVLVALGVVGGMIALLPASLFLLLRAELSQLRILGIGFVCFGFYLLAEWIQFRRGKTLRLPPASLWTSSIVYLSIIVILLLAWAAELYTLGMQLEGYNHGEKLSPSTLQGYAFISLTLAILPAFGIVCATQLLYRTKKLRQRRARWASEGRNETAPAIPSPAPDTN